MLEFLARRGSVDSSRVTQRHGEEAHDRPQNGHGAGEETNGVDPEIRQRRRSPIESHLEGLDRNQREDVIDSVLHADTEHRRWLPRVARSFHALTLARMAIVSAMSRPAPAIGTRGALNSSLTRSPA